MKINFLAEYLISIILVTSMSCSNNISVKKINIDWRPVFNTEGAADFCQIDKCLKDTAQFIISYSHSFTIGGGFKIVKLTLKNSAVTREVLLEDKKSGLSFVNIYDSIIGCIQNDFNDNTLHTSLLISTDEGLSWKKKNTPITGLRKFCIADNIIIAEGNFQGVGTVVKTVDLGNSWNNINGIKQNYKSFYLTNSLLSNNKIFCIGSTSFNERDSKLLLFDFRSERIKKIFNLEKVNSYIKPISKIENLHAVMKNNQISLYSYLNNEMYLENKFKIPDKTVAVENLFISDSLYIITTEEGGAGKLISWISYEKGEKWEAYNQERGFKLIYNPNGELFMIDSNNYILLGKYFD